MSNYFYTHDSDVTWRNLLTGLARRPSDRVKSSCQRRRRGDGGGRPWRVTVTTFNQQQAVTRWTISVLVGTAELLLQNGRTPRQQTATESRFSGPRPTKKSEKMCTSGRPRDPITFASPLWKIKTESKRPEELWKAPHRTEEL